jgi:hypothetical protein
MSHSGTDPVEFSPPDPEVAEKLAEYDEVGSPLALKEAADAAALHDGRAPPDPSLGLALARQRVAGWAEILERLTRDIDPEFDPETPPARGAPTKRERDATAAGREPERDHRPAGTPGQYRGDRTEPGAHRQLRQERQTVSGPFGHHRARPPHRLPTPIGRLGYRSRKSRRFSMPRISPSPTAPRCWPRCDDGPERLQHERAA